MFRTALLRTGPSIMSAVGTTALTLQFYCRPDHRPMVPATPNVTLGDAVSNPWRHNGQAQATWTPRRASCCRRGASVDVLSGLNSQNPLNGRDWTAPEGPVGMHRGSVFRATAHLWVSRSLFCLERSGLDQGRYDDAGDECPEGRADTEKRDVRHGDCKRHERAGLVAE